VHGDTNYILHFVASLKTSCEKLQENSPREKEYQLFCFLAPLGSFFTNMPFAVSFQKMDPLLGAIIIGAEATHSGATFFGASIFIRGS
jgi:hypothetical protein